MRTTGKGYGVNIGVFGGTFDPVHWGHLIIGGYVRHALALEKIVFVPSMISPHKQEQTAAAGEERLAMLRLAVRGEAGFEVSDMEIVRGGVSYTVDTLSQFHKISPGCHLSLLIGADNYAEFGTWKEPERVRSLARLVVMTRPGSRVDSFAAYGEEVRIRVPEIAVSSSDIRRRAKGGETIRYLVPDRVAEYIRSHHLYR
jgi:nicotinate-nucleotide adenylyltransferase